MVKTILVVDDDPAQRRLLQAAVERHGFRTKTADDGAVAVRCIETDEDVDLIMLDLVMPGMSGIEALKLIRQRRPELPAIVLTASGGIDTVVQAMQAGANDFFVKPASPERIMVSIRNALDMSNLKGEVVRLKKKAANTLGFEDMIASAPAMRAVVRLGERAAASNIPVLITGESGVGKELLARAIQGASERAGRPFVTVNCGAIPENLVESILFGHVKGSFTGATDNHAGKFVEAHGGTLFLDEVGELPLDMQVKLLRVLQEGEVDPVGGKRPVKVDVRIISATNKDLAKLVADNAFRFNDPRQTGTTDIQFTNNANWSQITLWIQDECLQIRKWSADYTARTLGIGLLEYSPGYMHRGFGDTVHIDQFWLVITMPRKPVL